jgi:Ran GTPase-activating protein (RanGAP) involved in mRNA processing and transport
LITVLRFARPRLCEGKEIIDPSNFVIDLVKAKGCTQVLLDSLGLRDAGMVSVAAALESMADLHTLSLHGNSISDEGAAALASVLANDRSTIVELYLDSNKIGDAGFAALGTALIDNTRLAVLDLDHNPISDAGLAALMKNMHLNKALYSLDLVSLGITDEGASAVGDFLASGSYGNLTVIDMSSNDIGDEGARALANGLEKNHILCELILTGNEIGDFSAEAKIEEFIYRNRLRRQSRAASGANGEKELR